MLDEHYAGLINIADYWVVGDIRTESITAIASGTTGEAQSAQDIDLVILGMNHDNLSDGSGMAAITVQTKNMLSTPGYIRSNYGDPDYALWSASQRRTWCNNEFKSALPSWIQTLIKPVTKITNRHCHINYSAQYLYIGQETTTDNTFLLSESEIFGSFELESIKLDTGTYGDPGLDGTQYEYMKTTANRIKTGPQSTWWMRSSIVNDSGYANFMRVDPDGTTGASGSAYRANGNFGIAPAFCL